MSWLDRSLSRMSERGLIRLSVVLSVAPLILIPYVLARAMFEVASNAGAANVAGLAIWSLYAMLTLPGDVRQLRALYALRKARDV